MKKLFKKQKNFKKEHESLWLNINFYWKLAVSLMLTAAIFSIFFGYYLFMQINKEFVEVVNTTDGQIKTIKKERIDKVLEYFASKNQKSDQILVLPAPIVDPSL